MKELVLAFMMIFASVGAGAQVLYKVSGGNAKGDSYLLGTHHTAPAKVLKNIAGFEAALDAVDAVYGEVDESELTDPKVMEKMMELAKAPADSTISKVLSADELQLLDDILHKYTNNMAGASAVEPLTPSFVETQLAVMQAAAAFPDFDENDQIDMKVQKMAKKKKKATGHLETAEEQCNIIFGAPISCQAASLVRTLKQDMLSAIVSKRLAELYTDQDLDGMWILLTDPELGSTPDETERVVSKRNDAWTSKIKDVISEQSVMFVVGAGHLPGDRGLIKQLTAAGYEVTPVK